ncbi:MAG: NDP-sugar synthase, partial [Candidatus Bathyarchaeota archaeon]
MKVIVLAGGYGTRLRPLTYTKPKPMLPLAGKPILQFIVESIAGEESADILVTTNYCRGQIIDYFGDGSDFGVRLVYPEEKKPLGTAGSVKNSEKHLNETFAVIQGDNITEIKFKHILSFHREMGGIATIALLPVERPHQFGIAQLDVDNKVLRFKEKPRQDEFFSDLANIGLYVFEPEVLDYIPSGVEYDFAKNVFPKLLSSGEKIYGFPTRGFWTDVGIPENYMKAVRWILSKLKGKRLAENAEVEKASISGSVEIGEGTRIEHGAEITGPVMIGDSCIIGHNSRITANSVIGSNVKIGRKARVVGSLVYEETQIGTGSYLNNCIVAEKCRLGSNIKIDEMSILGASCEIGDYARIHKGSRIWPKARIA